MRHTHKIDFLAKSAFSIYKNMLHKALLKSQSYIRNTKGTVLVTFALLAPVLVGSAGMALDFSQAYLVQQRLHQALDSAALAAAASSDDPTVVEQKVQDFFDVNYPPEKIGATIDPSVQIIGDEVIVTGQANYRTLFLNVLGIEELTVTAETIVVREVQGIEVVLVLDNTGSMATNNNIRTLRDATEDFIDIMFDNATDPDFVKIGMVPYANSVRVGMYGLGENPDGSEFDNGNVFVTVPDDVSFTNDHTSDDWYGCVIEHRDNGYDDSATHVSGSKGQLWLSSGVMDGHGWDPTRNNNDPSPDDTTDTYEGPWDIYSFGFRIARNQRCRDLGGAWSNNRCSNCTGNNGRCADDFCLCWLGDGNFGTNRSCPLASIMPLTSDRDALLDHIPNMQAHGNTLGNIGMIWGYRVISPNPPFSQAEPYSNNIWRKAVVMMTDGNNTRDGIYSSFWFRNNHSLTVNNFNERLEETCQNMKDQGILIYTVTFESGVNETTKGFYERCASTPDQYFDAPDPDDLIDAFNSIARELSNLHIRS